jgi:hypothetical protein
MDKSQIANLLITMVVTIVTTAIVTRLSLNKGSLGVATKLKARFTPKVKTYMAYSFGLLLSLALVIYAVVWGYYFFTEPNPPPVTRAEVASMITNAVLGNLGSYLLVQMLFNLVSFAKTNRRLREQEIERQREKELLAELEPVMDTLRETIRLANEDRIENPPPKYPDDKPS